MRTIYPLPCLPDLHDRERNDKKLDTQLKAPLCIFSCDELHDDIES